MRPPRAISLAGICYCRVPAALRHYLEGRPVLVAAFLLLSPRGNGTFKSRWLVVGRRPSGTRLAGMAGWVIRATKGAGFNFPAVGT
jgi:hypothetical protein